MRKFLNFFALTLIVASSLGASSVLAASSPSLDTESYYPHRVTPDCVVDLERENLKEAGKVVMTCLFLNPTSASPKGENVVATICRHGTSVPVRPGEIWFNDSDLKEGWTKIASIPPLGKGCAKVSFQSPGPETFPVGLKPAVAATFTPSGVDCHQDWCETWVDMRW